MLTYFRLQGKYYADGEFEVPDDMPIYRIFAEVKQLREAKRLPGLIVGHSDFIVLVDVPNHKHNHPALIGTGRSEE